MRSTLDSAQSDSSPYAVELVGLTKIFGELRANDQVSLRVRTGTIHAVVGENGAGKSTAMKMLFGMIRPDEGQILIHGQAWGKVGQPWRSPSDSMACGIGMVHQHFMLSGPDTALDNVILGAEKGSKFWINRAEARAVLEQICQESGFQMDWNARVEDLPVGIQQRIEIVKLLYRNADILILDEPTAVLTPQEIGELFLYLRKLKEQGKTILIITHKLKEVMALSDEVTVFRKGKVVNQLVTEHTTPEDLAEAMVGRKINLSTVPPPPPVLGDAALRFQSVSLTSAQTQKWLLRDLSFEVRRGEVVGIAGIEGNGQSELLKCVNSPQSWGKKLRGQIEVLSQVTLGGTQKRATWGHAQIRGLKMGWIPEDRHREGLVLNWTLQENFLLGMQRFTRFCKWGWIRGKNVREAFLKSARDHDIRPVDPDAKISGLSGGNQQKLIIAREFEHEPELLVAAQPTRGVDVGAIEAIHKKILDARNSGAGVLLISSELDEIFALSDRILVMHEGRWVAEYRRGEVTEKEIGLAMAGGDAHVRA